MNGRFNLGVVVWLAVLGWIPSAAAHFILRAPACYSEQDDFGTPLKSAPCGQDDPANPVVLTGELTHLPEGGVLRVSIDEVVTHPGHYRVAIAEDMASLPADPPVTAGATPCGSTEIDPNPSLPLLADGLFEHTSALSGTQTVDIPLPAGFTCDNCVLQVVQFMSNHGLNNPGGCFYHHCAMVTIGGAATDGGGTNEDAGATAGSDGGLVGSDDGAVTVDTGTEPSASDGGCGCGVLAEPPPAHALGLGLFTLGLAARWRRRR